MGSRITRVGEDSPSLPNVNGKKGLGLAGTTLGLILTGVAAKVDTAEAALPAPTFDASTNVAGASTVGISEAWPTAIDPDPSNGTSSDVHIMFSESDMASYAWPKYLAPGASTASDVAITGFTSAYGCQYKAVDLVTCFDEAAGPQELTDISGGADWSSLSETPDMTYWGVTAGEFTYDQISGDSAVIVSSGDMDVEYLDGTVIANSSYDEIGPVLDSVSGREFYMINGTEMWMRDSSDGSTQRVTGLDDCYPGYFEPNNRDWYCSEWNGTDYDITVRHETTYDTVVVEEPDTGDTGDTGEVVDTGDSAEDTDVPVDTGDSGETVDAACLTESPSGPYEAPDTICLGTGALVGVEMQDVIYDGSQVTTLDEIYDRVSFEATDGEDFTLDSLGVNGWTFEPDFVGSDGESVIGGYGLGISGFAEGEGTAVLTLTSGQLIATDASGHTETVTVGTWSIPDERLVTDTGGEGDADTDADSDVDTDDSGTEDTDTDSGTEDTDTDSGTEDTDEEKKIKTAEPEEPTGCATPIDSTSTRTGWMMAAVASVASLFRRRKQQA